MRLSKIKEKTSSLSGKISESKKYLTSISKSDFEKKTVLFFKKILVVLKKNYLVSSRNPKLYLSLILAPLFFVLLVGLAFNTTQLRSEIKISIYDESPNETIALVFKEISHVEVVPSYSEEDCKKKINNKKSLSCISVLKEENEESFDVNIYLDYSRMSAYPNVYTTVREVLSLFEKEVTVNFIEELRSQIEPETLGLEEIQKDLENAEKELVDASNKLNELATSLSSDSSFYKYKIDEVIYTITVLDEALHEYQILIKIYREDIAIQKEEAEKAYQDAKSARKEVEKVVNVCGASGKDLSDEIEDIEFIDFINADPNPGCTSAKTIHGVIWGYEQTFKAISTGLERADKDLEIAEENLAELKQAIGLYKEDLENEKQQITESEEYYSFEIVSFQESLETHSAMLIEYNELIDKTKIDVVEFHSSLNPDEIVNKFRKKFLLISGERSMLDYSLHIIIPFILLLSSLLISITINRNDYKTSAYQRNKMLKNNFLIFSGNTLFVLFVMIIELLFILLLFNIFFGSETLNNLPNLLLFSSTYILIWAVVGFILSNYIKSDEGAIFSGTILGLLVFFIGDTILPMESFPKALIPLYNVNPFVHFSDILRINFLTDEVISFFNQDFWLLVLLFMTFLFVALAIIWRDIYANNS